MKKVNYKNRWLSTVALVAMSLTLFSCLWIRSVTIPETAEANSSFDVRMVLDMKYPFNSADNSNICFGYVGVQLPVGWTIEADELVFEYYPNEANKAAGGVYYEGTFEADEAYTEICESNNPVEEVSGYYWAGFSTPDLISDKMDSVVVKIKVHTDNQTGEKYLTLIAQENGTIKDADGNDIKPATLDDNKPAARECSKNIDDPSGALDDDGNPVQITIYDNSEGCIFYSEAINVIPNNGNGIKTTNKDDKSYKVLSLGNGQVRIDLQNNRKLGATATVYNTRGQIVATQVLNSTENVLSANLDRGVYSVAVQQDGVRSYKKVMVK
ncbi:MAG: T9SS type A sorting domain-containing protein [Dysgonamonadaceae bacterium]|jgi:hypothetical protein|nr:T9SS type A sorting domain-containing protein [Dysgonamonadaceae bacterium]